MIRTVRIALFLLFAALPSLAHAQSMTAITASTVNTGSSSGSAPVTGTVCLHAVNQAKAPISVTVAGGEQPFCQVLSAGALTGSLNVPNPVTDSAPGHGYDCAKLTTAMACFMRVRTTFTGTTVNVSGGIGTTYIADTTPNTPYSYLGPGCSGTETSDTAGVLVLSSCTGNVTIGTVSISRTFIGGSSKVSATVQ